MADGTPIPVLGVPTLNRNDLLARMVSSIDYPVSELVVVLNGDSGLCAEYPLRMARAHPMVARVSVAQHTNAGVAASWNGIITRHPAPWWMLVNDDIEFARGDLERMAWAMEDGLQSPSRYERTDVWYGNHGASWWALSARAVQLVGTFDENLWPAYLEDCDWSYRAKLMGLNCRDVPGVQARHGDGLFRTGSCTVNLSPDIARANARTHEGNFTYYERKWGGRNGQERFERPFNRPDWTPDLWKFQPEFRRDQQARWGARAKGAA